MIYPLVSVIIPCFNSSQYVEDVIKSVISQSFKEWEIIIVDDGSQDNLFEVIEKYLENTNIKYFRKENGGLSSARNYGISKSSGSYILPLDADDKIEKTYLEKAVKAFNFDNELKLVYCRASYFGAKEGEWILAPYSFPEILLDNVIFCSAVFKKEDFVKAGGYSENLKFGLEDWDLWIRLLSPNGKVFKIPEILFYYRKHHGTSMSDKFSDREKHNQIMNSIFDNNREIYNTYFGNPIIVAGSSIRYKNKIEEIEKSKLYKIEVKIKKILRKIKIKFNIN